MGRASPVRRGRVLVVDDDPLVRRAIERVLRAAHDVTALESAREALARISAGERFDAIVSDMMMPDMTGMDLHARLVQIAPDQAARMIFLTGGATCALARAFLDDMPDRCLQKPFDTDTLLEVVDHRVRRAAR